MHMHQNSLTHERRFKGHLQLRFESYVKSFQRHSQQRFESHTKSNLNQIPPREEREYFLSWASDIFC